MRAKLVAVTGVLLILPVYAALAAPITSFNQLVVFGDSLSDNGNAAIALGGSLPGNYAPNAFTDGPHTTPSTTGPFGLWVDQLSVKMGVSDPTPFLTGGTNYAVASALTGHNPAFTIPPTLTVVPNTADQVTLFSVASLGSASSKSLYTLWAGANDINGGNNPVTAADNIFSNIKSVAGIGGSTFLWLNLPLLGETPDGRASGQTAALDAASLAFDSEWAADIAKLRAQGINVIGVDVETLFAQILASPGTFGFTDVKDPAWCGTGGLATCASNNPNSFAFWDGQHPTTAADALIANLALADLTANASSTPEPMSIGLTLIGICGVLLRRRLRSDR